MPSQHSNKKTTLAATINHDEPTCTTHRKFPLMHPSFESRVPQISPPHPQLKPALKLPPSNAIDDWAQADHYIGVQIVPLVVAETDLSQKALLLVEGIYGYFAQHFGIVNHRQHRSRRRQGKFNRAMNKMREEKNEMRRKYRAALRSNQPKETVIQLASAYHRLVREHNRIRRQKESHDLQSRMQKDRRQCAITSGNLLLSCSMMIAILGHLHLSPKQKPPPFSQKHTPVNTNNLSNTKLDEAT